MNIPSSWQILPLQKVAKLQTGLALNSKLKILCPVCVPYLRVANVQAGHIELGDLKTVVIESSTMQRFVLHSGDVLLTEGGDFDKLGRGAVWRGQISPCLHQNHVFAIRTDRLKLLPEFLSYQTESNYGRNYFLSCSKQSTNLASINSTQIKNFPVIVPPLNEQRRIAEFLGTWDKALEKLERLITAKEKRFRGLMQRALAFEKSEHISFSKIFEVISEKNQPALPLLSVTQNNGVIPRDMLEGRVMSPEGSLEGYKVVQKKDFVVSLRSFQGGLEYSHFTGLISPAYTVLRARKKLDHEFYRFFFKSYAFIHHYLDLAVIGIRDGKQISIPDLLTIAIPFPDIQKQKNIAFELGLNEKEINLLKKELAALKQQKRGLMQKLLTGTWKVS